MVLGHIYPRFFSDRRPSFGYHCTPLHYSDHRPHNQEDAMAAFLKDPLISPD